MAKITIGPLDFRTKAAAKEFFRAIRDAYGSGERLSEEDAAHLHVLIARHPEAEAKIGCGISHFTVERDVVFGTTRHFTLHRVDGSSTDFSFHACVDGGNGRSDRLEALRREIEEQITSFRDMRFSQGPVVCPYLGVELTPAGSHVDHMPPNTFMRIAEEWMQARGLSYEQIEITPPRDNQLVTRMTNPGQKSEWAEFHRTRASLRIISPLANLSHAKKKNPGA